MKKIFYTCAFFVISFFLIFNLTHAAFSLGIPRSFGGRIISMVSLGVVCEGGVGPITITPAGGPAMSYLVPPGVNVPNMGGQILGLYNVIYDVKSCQTKSNPPVPYPVYRVTYFGISRY
jgi:hypothetical protein